MELFPSIIGMPMQLLHSGIANMIIVQLQKKNILVLSERATNALLEKEI
tara:strand:+ start:3681 stop:3827 length:147 start_codon:yes stop_codon:yes gene_type:complete